jgi:hypothetical protein
MKIQIIFPKDETTDFLEEIIQDIKPLSESLVHRLDSKDDHSSIFNLASEFEDDDLILFLGHGTSNSLAGSETFSNQFGAFMTDLQIKVFQGKKVILLSCRSSEYLLKFGKQARLKAAIGFPNLITDWNEVEYPDSIDEVEGILKSDIEVFRSIIVRVASKSLVDYLKSELSFYGLHERIKQRSSIELAKLYENKFESVEIPLGRMIRSLRDDMYFFGN